MPQSISSKGSGEIEIKIKFTRNDNPDSQNSSSALSKDDRPQEKSEPSNRRVWVDIPGFDRILFTNRDKEGVDAGKDSNRDGGHRLGFALPDTDDDTIPKVILIKGPPGSGKTVLSAQLLSSFLKHWPEQKSNTDSPEFIHYISTNEKAESLLDMIDAFEFFEMKKDLARHKNADELYLPKMNSDSGIAIISHNDKDWQRTQIDSDGTKQVISRPVRPKQEKKSPKNANKDSRLLIWTKESVSKDSVNRDLKSKDSKENKLYGMIQYEANDSNPPFLILSDWTNDWYEGKLGQRLTTLPLKAVDNKGMLEFVNIDGKQQSEADCLSPKVLFLDSLNLVNARLTHSLLRSLLLKCKRANMLTFLIMEEYDERNDSHTKQLSAELDFLVDIVIELGEEYRDGYYTQSIQIPKKHFGKQALGKHNYHIGTRRHATDNIEREHWGFMVYPSIHNYLSQARTDTFSLTNDFVQTGITHLDSILSPKNSKDSVIEGKVIPQNSTIVIQGQRSGAELALGINLLSAGMWKTVPGKKQEVRANRDVLLITMNEETNFDISREATASFSRAFTRRPARELDSGNWIEWRHHNATVGRDSFEFLFQGNERPTLDSIAEWATKEYYSQKKQSLKRYSKIAQDLRVRIEHCCNAEELLNCLIECKVHDSLGKRISMESNLFSTLAENQTKVGKDSFECLFKDSNNFDFTKLDNWITKPFKQTDTESNREDSKKISECKDSESLYHFLEKEKILDAEGKFVHKFDAPDSSKAIEGNTFSTKSLFSDDSWDLSICKPTEKETDSYYNKNFWTEEKTKELARWITEALKKIETDPTEFTDKLELENDTDFKGAIENLFDRHLLCNSINEEFRAPTEILQHFFASNIALNDSLKELISIKPDPEHFTLSSVAKAVTEEYISVIRLFQQIDSVEKQNEIKKCINSGELFDRLKECNIIDDTGNIKIEKEKLFPYDSQKHKDQWEQFLCGEAPLDHTSVSQLFLLKDFTDTDFDKVGVREDTRLYRFIDALSQTENTENDLSSVIDDIAEKYNPKEGNTGENKGGSGPDNKDKVSSRRYKLAHLILEVFQTKEILTEKEEIPGKNFFLNKDFQLTVRSELRRRIDYIVTGEPDDKDVADIADSPSHTVTSALDQLKMLLWLSLSGDDHYRDSPHVCDLNKHQKDYRDRTHCCALGDLYSDYRPELVGEEKPSNEGKKIILNKWCGYILDADGKRVGEKNKKECGKNGCRKMVIAAFRPGCITPEQFLYNVQELLDQGQFSRVMFYSTANLPLRFPLLANDSLFVPAMIDLFKSKNVMSIFIDPSGVGSDEKLSYGLKNLADYLIRTESSDEKNVPSVTQMFPESKAREYWYYKESKEKKPAELFTEYIHKQDDSVKLKIKEMSAHFAEQIAAVYCLPDEKRKKENQKIKRKFTNNLIKISTPMPKAKDQNISFTDLANYKFAPKFDNDFEKDLKPQAAELKHFEEIISKKEKGYGFNKMFAESIRGKSYSKPSHRLIAVDRPVNDLRGEKHTPPEPRNFFDELSKHFPFFFDSEGYPRFKPGRADLRAMIQVLGNDAEKKDEETEKLIDTFYTTFRKTRNELLVLDEPQSEDDSLTDSNEITDSQFNSLLEQLSKLTQAKA